MHQIASTFISYFLSPFNWIILLVVVSFVVQRRAVKRFCRILALVIFLIFSNQALIDWYADQWQPEPAVLGAGKVYSCGIVAGGFASPDEDNKGYFNATADRFIQALKLYKQGKINHILISGGNGKASSKGFREGAWVKNELITMGVPDSVVFVEDRSNNTADNAANARKILDTMHLRPPYLLISSAHHLPRAMLLFQKKGVLTEPYPCNYIAGRRRFSLASFVPRFGLLYTWELFMKEAMGFTLYRYFKK